MMQSLAAPVSFKGVIRVENNRPVIDRECILLAIKATIDEAQRVEHPLVRFVRVVKGVRVIRLNLAFQTELGDKLDELDRKLASIEPGQLDEDSLASWLQQYFSQVLSPLIERYKQQRAAL